MNLLLRIKIWLLIDLLKRVYGYSKINTKIIYAQAFHETGNFKSLVFKEGRNLFGMREAKTRPRSVEGTIHNHAYYKTHFQSVRDYFLRQKYFGISNKSNHDFIEQTVNSNYAEDIQYNEKWRKVISTIKPPAPFTFIAFTGLFFLVLMLYRKKLKS